MTPDIFKVFGRDFMNDMMAILEVKGHDYTSGSDDRLRNFKDIAKSVGCSPMLVWFVYFRKHVDSLATFVQHGKLKSEPPSERFKDVANYALLGAALAEDMIEKKPAKSKRKSKDPIPSAFDLEAARRVLRTAVERSSNIDAMCTWCTTKQGADFWTEEQNRALNGKPLRAKARRQIERWIANYE